MAADGVSFCCSRSSLLSFAAVLDDDEGDRLCLNSLFIF